MDQLTYENPEDEFFPIRYEFDIRRTLRNDHASEHKQNNIYVEYNKTRIKQGAYLAFFEPFLRPLRVSVLMTARFLIGSWCTNFGI